MDLHAGQIQDFFNIPVDNLFATPILLEYMKKNYQGDGTVIVSPDTGGVERARAFGKRLGANLAIIDKRREGPNESQVMNIIGNVKDRRVIILDDLIDTAGTIVQAAEALKKRGRQGDFGLLYAPGPFRTGHRENPGFRPQGADRGRIRFPSTKRQRPASKIKVLSVAGILSEAVRRIYYNDSVSSLFI